jgi:hypothetical protein
MTERNLDGGSESAMDMVLDNLGMDEADLGGDEGGEELGGGEEYGEIEEPRSRCEAFESNEDRRQARQQQQPQRQQPGQQEPRQQQPGQLPRGAEVQADQRGNLIGPDGKVVAKAGFEARMYQEAQRSRRELATEQIRSQDLSGRLNRAIELGQQFHGRVEQLTAQLNDRNTAAARLGLDDSESITAMQIASEAKRDPVSALKRILTMAAAAGVDVTKIGIAPGGVDTHALMGMVQNEIRGALTPLQQRMQAEQQTQQQQETAQRVYQETEREVQGFFIQNPSAREYIPIFHAVLSQPQFQHMSMSEVWARIQLNHMRLTSQNGNRQVRQARRVMPTGRGAPSFAGQGDMAPVNQSYDSILRETLDALGV